MYLNAPSLSCHEEGSLVFWDSYPCPISNPRIISQIWLLSLPLIVLFPYCRTEQSTTELRALQTQPPRPWDKLQWQFWTCLVSEANFILLPCKQDAYNAPCKASLPICPSLEGSCKGPSPSADAESRTSIVLLSAALAKSTQQAFERDDVGCFQTPITAGFPFSS